MITACNDGLQFDWIGFNQINEFVVIFFNGKANTFKPVKLAPSCWRGVCFEPSIELLFLVFFCLSPADNGNGA